MSAYIIFQMTALHDAEKMDEYRKMAHPTFEPYGVKVLVARKGRQEQVEGDNVLLTVVLAFEDYDKAVAWYNSPEYQSCKKFREDAADIHTVIVEEFQP